MNQIVRPLRRSVELHPDDGHVACGASHGGCNSLHKFGEKNSTSYVVGILSIVEATNIFYSQCTCGFQKKKGGGDLIEIAFHMRIWEFLSQICQHLCRRQVGFF